MSLRKEIYQVLFEIGDWDRIVNWGYVNPEFSLPDEVTKILKLVEKRIDKVEQDYKNELNNWGKKQPMTDMYPKEMATLERIRKELV